MMIALALALSYTERFIPLQLLVPLPGVKLGLANIVTLFGGGITGLLFSLLGGVLAMSMMTLARRVKLFSIYGVSILGAAAHNVGQILAAMVLMQSVYVAAYLPYLLVVAVFTGLFTGGACAGVLRILKNVHVSVPSEMCR